MKWSDLFIPTLKEEPAEVKNKSHKLLLRGGFIRPLMAGVYTFLPLGQKVRKKIIRIIREEMDRMGGQEILMPAINPISTWKKTGRNESMGSILYRLLDRNDRKLCLAPTHEEVITEIVSNEIRSYKELPQVWYQIQRKYRDEPRAKSGLLRAKEFAMKDSYTFALNREQLHESYKRHRKAYRRIFDRCGLQYNVVGASSGLMGGSGSEEFMAPSPAGEDTIIKCTNTNCDYRSNKEIAETHPPQPDYVQMEKEKVHTPQKKSIEEVAEYLDLPKTQLVKTLLYIMEDTGEPVMILIRGDRELLEAKAEQYLGSPMRQATSQEAKQYLGADLGYIGPYDVDSMKIIVDSSIPEDIPFATGANQKEYHIKGLTLNELGLEPTTNLVEAQEGDRCVKCSAEVKTISAIELGHIFKLGTKYSEGLDATVLDEEGQERPVIMGSYGIGVGRILAAAIEQNHDDKGIKWPMSLAPYEVNILVIRPGNAEHLALAEKLHDKLQQEGLHVIVDEREESPGRKFNDAELVGFPITVVLGPRGLEDDRGEIQIRKTGEQKEVDISNIASVVIDVCEEIG